MAMAAQATWTPLKPKYVSSKVFEEILGKNDDWGHLSKRRQTARMEKIERDVRWAKRLSDVRANGVVEKVKEMQKVQAVKSLQTKAQKEDKFI